MMSGDEPVITPTKEVALPVRPMDAPRTRTPMYEAINAPRYQRQALIRKIEDATSRRLICYVSSEAHIIDRDDTVGFVDLLHVVPRGNDLDLLLHTPGGEIDAAEKLISMVRTTVGTGKLRVIVPDFAKSAGTLMALGADSIVMSDCSELGPIDPQIRLPDQHGNLVWYAIQSHLDAYEAHALALKNDPGNVVAQIMLSKMDPALIKRFESTRARARTLAEKQLKLGMFRDKPGNFTLIAETLMDTKRWLSHGQMIGWQDARDIGLTIDYVDQKSDEWQLFWQLYCLQRLAIADNQKLFESDYASFPLDCRRS